MNYLILKCFFLFRLRKIKGLIVYGEPEVSIVAFSSDTFDIFRLSTALVEKGWNLNPLQFPAGYVFNPNTLLWLCLFHF